MSLKVTIPSCELFDPTTNEFFDVEGQTLVLEHSLVSLSKWESKWHKAFLSNLTEKTYDESLDYIRCMTLTQNVNPMIYRCIPADVIAKINEYIDDPMTATKLNESGGSLHGETPTAELIYYWMIALNVPMECQKWHLNRLLTLIRVCSIKNTPPKKMNRSEFLSKRNALNASRRKSLRTKG